MRRPAQPPVSVRITHIVSKSHLLDGLEDDDDIDLPSFNIATDEAFDEIKISGLGNDAATSEQLQILKQAFADVRFRSTLQSTPMDVDSPMTIDVDTTRWYAEARNRQPPRPQTGERLAAINEMV